MQISFLSTDINSHRIILMLLSKSIDFNCQVMTPELNEEFQSLNPLQLSPVLQERELLIAGSYTLTEYIEERYPFQPLFPIMPIECARVRFFLETLQKNWCNLMNVLIRTEKKEVMKQAKEILFLNLTNSISYFKKDGFLDNLSNDITILECVTLPVLWRLKYFGIDLPPKLSDVKTYLDHWEAQNCFQASLALLDLVEIELNAKRFDSNFEKLKQELTEVAENTRKIKKKSKTDSAHAKAMVAKSLTPSIKIEPTPKKKASKAIKTDQAIDLIDSQETKSAKKEQTDQASQENKETPDKK